MTSMTSAEQLKALETINHFSQVFNSTLQDVMGKLLKVTSGYSGDYLLGDPAAHTSGDGAVATIDPQAFLEKQMGFFEKQQRLWQFTIQAFMGESTTPIIAEDKADKRFSDTDWTGNPAFHYIKQAYLLNAEYITQLVDVFHFEDRKTEDQIRFYTRQFVNSMSPSNYVLTNPEVCREVLASDGENLARGIDKFMRDLEYSPEEAFRVTQVEIDAFELGKDIANTPGHVVYENRLVQLIYYTPSTEEVHEQPLLIVPPFINKYYILDLNEKKSLVKWLVSQGFSVFMVSWLNPDKSAADIALADYLKEGIVDILDVVERLSGSSAINAAGYCVGGTLLGMAQAYLKQKGDHRIASMTLLTTLFDFSEPGEVGNYISPQSYPLVEQSVTTKGYLDGRVLGLSFSLLRENNLFWSFFIENYLKGKDPTPFDILYWNSDSTNIPASAYLHYLKSMYIDNQLSQGVLDIDGVRLDLSACDTPSYCLAAVADHIVLWSSAYRSAQLLGGHCRFVLTESGHVAGVVNPANKGKYAHWVNEAQTLSHTTWLENANLVEGSWWHDWKAWLLQRSGALRQPNVQFDEIEPAPGRYVRVRLESLNAEPA